MKSNEPEFGQAQRKMELARLRSAYVKMVETDMRHLMMYEKIIEDIEQARAHLRVGELDKAELLITTALRRWSKASWR